LVPKSVSHSPNSIPSFTTVCSQIHNWMGYTQRVMANDFLPIQSVERALSYAEKELAKATEARLQAHAVEEDWHTEVSSLKNLLKIRQGRTFPRPESAEVGGDGAAQPTPESAAHVTPPGEKHVEVNRVNWMEGLAVSAGRRGTSPPEILAEAAKQGITMHPNYPYTALRKLVSDGRLTKRAGRYYKESQAELALAG
jgi:hypothetical protein